MLVSDDISIIIVLKDDIGHGKMISVIMMQSIVPFVPNNSSVLYFYILWEKTYYKARLKAEFN